MAVNTATSDKVIGLPLTTLLLRVVLTLMCAILATACPGQPLDPSGASPVAAVPFYGFLLKGRNNTLQSAPTPRVLINEAVMFRENNRSKYAPHLMYIYKYVRNGNIYFEVSVYDISHVSGQTWRVYEREIGLIETIGPNCTSFSLSMPSIAVSPSKHQVILHGFGPGECANLLLVYEDRKTRVIRTQQQQQGTPLVSEFGSALATIPITGPLRGKYSGEIFYLMSYGGCPWRFHKPHRNRCRYHLSNNLHRLLIRGHVFGDWEYMDVGRKSRKPHSSAYSSLFNDNENSMLLLGGVRGTLMFGIWKFDLWSRTWTAVKSNLGDFPANDIEGMAITKQSAHVLTLYWPSPMECRIIVCNIWSTTASCAIPTAPETSALVLPDFCGFSLCSGLGHLFFVEYTSDIIRTSIIHETSEGNRTNLRMESLDLQVGVRKNFPGFANFFGFPGFGKVPAILVPSSSAKNLKYMFFGIVKYKRPLPSMPVWTLKGSQYALLFPIPGPDIPRRLFHTITSVTSNTAILYGGYERREPGMYVNHTYSTDPYPWCFNVHHHFWMKASVITGNPCAREHHISFRYNASAIVIQGGSYRDGWRSRALGDLWMFVIDDEDHCQGRWHNLTGQVKKGYLPRLRGHSVTPTGNGVLVYGGELTLVASAEVNKRIILLNVRSPSEVVVQEIPISPGIRPRLEHSLSYSGSDLILLGGRYAGEYQREAEWALLISFQINGTSTVATWAKFFKFKISSHIVLGDKVFGGSTSEYPEYQHVFSILHTTGLCPVGYERDQNNICRPCAIGYYSANLQQQCTKCNQTLTTSNVASSDCGPEGPCKPYTCSHRGQCIVDEVNFKHICVCQFGYLPDDDCKTPSIYLALMAALVFTTTLTILTIALIQFLRKRRALHAKELELVETNRDLYRSKRKLSQLDHGTCIAWSDLKIKKQLATGRFSEVLLAELGDMAVVVKRLPKFVATSSPYDAFIREAEVLRTLRHPNIVMFLGAGKDKTSGRPFLVMEYLRRGSLCDVIHDKCKVVEHIDRLRFSLDAARGIKYLHSTSPPRIHRDIKSANMLVSDKWVVKVADMETTRFLAILQANTEPKETSPNAANRDMDRPKRTTSFTSQQSDLLTTPLLPTSSTTTVPSDDSRGNTQDRHRDTESMASRIGMTCGVGTDRWRSPESIKKNLYTEKHDVYSFGVVMWELSTRQIPYGHLHKSDDVLDEIAGRSKLIFPPSIRYAYRHLAEQCIKTDPEERPSMDRVVHELTSQLDSI